MKDKRIDIRVSEELKTNLTDQAGAEGKTLSGYIITSLENLSDKFILCPKCNAEALNAGHIPIIGSASVQCKKCGHVWLHYFN